MSGATCKGSYALGTACGLCARCEDERLTIERINKLGGHKTMAHPNPKKPRKILASDDGRWFEVREGQIMIEYTGKPPRNTTLFVEYEALEEQLEMYRKMAMDMTSSAAKLQKKILDLEIKLENPSAIKITRVERASKQDRL